MFFSVLQRPLSWLFVLMALVFAWRLTQSLLVDGYLGIDGGAYLEGFVQATTGQRYEPAIARPPLAPGWQLWPFITLLGPVDGLKVWGSLLAIAPLPSVYLLAKYFLDEINPWAKIGAVAFVAIDWWQSTMVATGPAPLLGMGLLALAWYALLKLAYSEGGQAKWHWTLIVSAGLMPHVNHTSAGFGFVFLPLFALALVWFSPDRHLTKWRIIPSGVMAALAGITALPWYVDNLPGRSDLLYDCAWIFLHHEWFIGVVQLLIASSVGGYAILKADHPGIKALGVCTVTMGFLGLWTSCDAPLSAFLGRMHYFMAVPFWPLLWWLVVTRWLPYVKQKAWWLIGPCFAVAFAFMFAMSFYVFESEASRPLFPPAVVEALELTDPNQTVAISSVLQAFWINGLREQRSPAMYFRPPPPDYAEGYADLRCILNWVPGCTPEDAIVWLDVGYILIYNQRYADYAGNIQPYYLQPPNAWELTNQADWLDLIYDEEGVKLWQVKR